MTELNLLGATRAVFASALAANDKLVALALLNHWSKSSETFPSVERLAKWTSLSRCSVMRSVKSLKATGAITVVASNGRANRYDLSGLTSLPQRPVSHSDQSPGDTQPVSHSDRNQSPRETRSDPLSNPGKGSTSPASRRSTPRSSRKKDPEQPSADSHLLKIHFVEEFKKHRGNGEEPDFGDAWSRAMQAFGKLSRRKGGLAAAKGVVSRALADPYVRRINPWELLDDWNKHVGPKPGQQALRVQSGGTDQAQAETWGRDGARALEAD